MTPELAAQVGGADAARVLDIIVELDGGTDSSSSIAAAKEEFSRAAEPIVDVISDAGGEVVGGVWLNHTLRARVPAHAVRQIATLDGVRQVDLPHAIQAE
jgi:hypothetical protein